MQNENTRKVVLTNMFSHSKYIDPPKELGIERKAEIGHEIINLYADDNGCFNIWLGAKGVCKSDIEIDVLMLTKTGTENSLYKIIGKAVNCKVINGAKKSGKKVEVNNKNYESQKRKFFYGGKPLEDILGETEKENHYHMVTLKAQQCYEPKKNIFIAFNKYNEEDLSENIFFLDSCEKFSSSCLIEHVISNEDQNILSEIINNPELWNESVVPQFKTIVNDLREQYLAKEESYFSFLNIENQELQYSNAIYYFLNKYDLINEFLQSVCNINGFNNNFEVLREEKNIDFLIRDLDSENGKIVIIENKIKASITETDKDVTFDKHVEKVISSFKGRVSFTEEHKRRLNELIGDNNQENLINSQLSKYYIGALVWAILKGWSDEKINNDIHCYLLCPDYSKHLCENRLSSNRYRYAEKYSDNIITYSEIYDFFNSKLEQLNMDSNKKGVYLSFLEGLAIHSRDYDDSVKVDQLIKFIHRWEELQ